MPKVRPKNPQSLSPALQTHRSPQNAYWPYLTPPALLTQRKLRHRSTRTLNPLADAPPHHASPIFINTQHTSHRPLSTLHPSEAGALPNSIEMNEFTDFITPVVYVPKGSLEAYRNAPMWREFQNIVEWDESGVVPTDAELLQVAVAGGEITVTGIDDNTKVELFSMSGMLVGTAVGPCTLNVNSAPGVYILRAGNITRKLRL